MIRCPKDRRGLLTGAVAEEPGLRLDAICAERGWPVISKELQPDHRPLCLSILPTIAVADSVKVLKGLTARRVCQRFPVLTKRVCGGHLWSPSYVGTAGHGSAETLRRYIERCEHVTKRR